MRIKKNIKHGIMFCWPPNSSDQHLDSPYIINTLWCEENEANHQLDDIVLMYTKFSWSTCNFSLQYHCQPCRWWELRNSSTTRYCLDVRWNTQLIWPQTGYSRTPVTRTRINSNSHANSNLVPFPLDLIPLFSHFYAVNSNSNNSNSPLTRTKVCFPWSKFTLITRIRTLATHHGCPLKYPISSSCHVIRF